MRPTLLKIFLAVIILVTVTIGIRLFYNRPDTSLLTIREKHIYAELHNEFISQRDLLLERYHDHFQPLETPGQRRLSTYDLLKKLLPAAAKTLANLPDSIDIRQALVIVTPSRLVRLNDQIALTRYNNCPLINEFQYTGENLLRQWHDERAPDQPYLLVGINSAQTRCAVSSPTDLTRTAPFPCDERQCLTLTEAIALLAVRPTIMDLDSAMLVAGSMQSEYGTIFFPYCIRHKGKSLALDIWYPETKQDTVEWWAPQCVTRLW
jgi:hypothetical protein